MNVPQCLPLFSPRPPATGGGGRWPRLRICSEAQKSVPLEPISPIRNALRPRHLPAAAALRVACSRGRGSAGGERRLRPSQHRRVGRPRPRLLGPGGHGSGRMPRLASARAAEGTPAPGPSRGRGTSPRPDPRAAPAPRRARAGAPFPWDFRIHFRPGEGRKGSSRSAPCRKLEPPLPSGSRAQLPPVPTRTFNSSGRRRAQGCGRAGPSPGGGSSQRKYGGGFLRPAKAPLSWGGGNGEEGSRRPLSRTPPPQFCLDCCSREPALQLPFSPSRSPSCLRPLPPLLPPSPGPPLRTAHVPCVMASRPPGPSRAALGRGCSLARVRPAHARELPASDSGGRECGPSRLSPRPGLSAALPAHHPARLPRSGPGCGAGVSSKDGWERLEVQGDAGLAEPGFRRFARHYSFLCVLTVHLLDWQPQGEQGRGAAASF